LERSCILDIGAGSQQGIFLVAHVAKYILKIQMTDRNNPSPGSTEHLDVIIVGGGLSGIAAGYRVQHELPGRTYAVLEARSTIGGTWDLFRYPGIRSDSDMFTMVRHVEADINYIYFL
jgi:ribulose 1,5-bisphosphate synthetase/thiazole synthase